MTVGTTVNGTFAFQPKNTAGQAIAGNVLGNKRIDFRELLSMKPAGCRRGRAPGLRSGVRGQRQQRKDSENKQNSCGSDFHDIVRGTKAGKIRMKVYCCQLDIVWENKPENFRKVRALLERTRPEAGSMVVLPEMFSTGFSMNVAGIAEENSPGAEEFLREVARDLGVLVVGGLVNKGNDAKGRNQAVVFSPEGKEVTRYSKIHPFTFGGELDHYSRGERIEHFEWHGLKVAPFICYDLRFPEIFRTAVKQGAEMFVVIANWPNKREQHWVTLLQARAIENLAYVVGVNRAGSDPKLVYPGRTMIIDPHGNILADAGPSEEIISAAIEPDAVRSWRRDFPALKDIHWRD